MSESVKSLLIELLLPRTDRGVLIQVVATVVVVPLAIGTLVRRGRRELAWLASGGAALWVAFLGLRTLH